MDMHDIDELKQFGAAHARAQQITPTRYREICARITSDDEASPGSWTGEWGRAAETLRKQGRHLEACGYYNLARFPYVDGPARMRALRDCVAECARWSAARKDIERLEVDADGGRVSCWATGLSRTEPKPLLLIMGGIVSIKEQWAPLLTQLGKLGLAGVVTEMPGVGENTTPYTAESWQLISAIMDAVSDRADVSSTYAMALSFSGHMALRCSVRDRRIKGIVTVAAPVSDFFAEAGTQNKLPGITVSTLAHLTRLEPSAVSDHMRDWGLTADELSAVGIPVYYVASRRDEIIPEGDLRFLRDHVSRLHVLEYDEEHAAPRYAAETRAWVMLSILRMSGSGLLQRAALTSVWGVLRARRRLTELV
jgi:esterase FrsA